MDSYDYINKLEIQLYFIKSCFLVDRHKNQYIFNYDILDDFENEDFLNCIKFRKTLATTEVKNTGQLQSLIKTCNSISYIFDNDISSLNKNKIPLEKMSEDMKQLIGVIQYYDYNYVWVEGYDICLETNYKHKDTFINELRTFTAIEIRQIMDEIIETILCFYANLNGSAIDDNLYRDIFWEKYPHFSPWFQSGIDEEDFVEIIEKLGLEKVKTGKDKLSKTEIAYYAYYMDDVKPPFFSQYSTKKEAYEYLGNKFNCNPKNIQLEYNSIFKNREERTKKNRYKMIYRVLPFLSPEAKLLAEEEIKISKQNS